MKSYFWQMFGLATAFKILLIPAYYSTDFEVHRNWLAITHSLPINKWYVDKTSEWTLDYPPFFAYFEWLLSQVAKYVDPQMLVVKNLNYASQATVYFQRGSVIITDIVFAIGVRRCLRAMKISKNSQEHFAGELLLLLNVGLVFVDHIHFQYNGFLFGILLLSISFLLEDRYLWSAFTFALLLNFKHIFLYMAPAFAVYLMRFYCLDSDKNLVDSILKLVAVGITPFVLAFGPFWDQLLQVLSRLFPFKRGLTHAYWAPNFWALYNTADKAAELALGVARKTDSPSSTAGLVQDVKHTVLPQVTPFITFALTTLCMMPILGKLFYYTTKKDSKLIFLRSLVLCAGASFVFGWHVHEKAILLCLIPLSLLSLLQPIDAKYTYLLGFVGYFSLFPLLFHADLLIMRYSLHLAYIFGMYGQLRRVHKFLPKFNALEKIYLWGFVILPAYEHVLCFATGLNRKMPFMTLLLTSVYCSLGVLYWFIRYYIFSLNLNLMTTTKIKPRSRPNLRTKAKQKMK